MICPNCHNDKVPERSKKCPRCGLYLGNMKMEEEVPDKSVVADQETASQQQLEKEIKAEKVDKKSNNSFARIRELHRKEATEKNAELSAETIQSRSSQSLTQNVSDRGETDSEEAARVAIQADNLEKKDMSRSIVTESSQRNMDRSIAPAEDSKAIETANIYVENTISNSLDGYQLPLWDNFKYCITTGFSDFSGRARRSEYWLFSLAWLLIIVIGGMATCMLTILLMPFVDSSFGDTLGRAIDTYSVSLYVPMIVLICPILAVLVRRLHDVGHSGWNALWGVVPIIGSLILICFAVKESVAPIQAYGGYENRRKKLMDVESTPLKIKAFAIIFALSTLIGAGVGIGEAHNTLGHHRSGSTSSGYEERSKSKEYFDKAKEVEEEAAQKLAALEKRNAELDKKQKELDAKAKAQEEKQMPAQVNAKQAARALQNYHRYITAGNYGAAYNLFDANMQYNAGNVDAWAEGFSTTVRSEIDNVRVEYASPEKVILQFRLTAKDRTSSGIEENMFSGRAVMVNNNGNWYIHELEHKAM